MGGDPFVITNTPAFEILIEHERGKYGATFRNASEPIANRRFIGGDATTCSDLVDALVLAFSLLLRSDLGVSATDQPKASTRAPVDAPSPPLEARRQPEPLLAPPRERSAWLALGPLLATRDLPATAVGAMVSAGVQLSAPWELTAGAAYLGIERTTRYKATYAFSLTEGWLGLGHSLALDERLRWRTQFAPVFGMIHGFPESDVPFDPGDSRFFAMRLATQLRIEISGSLGLLAGFSSELRLKRWEFGLHNDSRVIWRQPYLGGRAELLLSFDLK
jgi:hypothetical protein